MCRPQDCRPLLLLGEEKAGVEVHSISYNCAVPKFHL